MDRRGGHDQDTHFAGTQTLRALSLLSCIQPALPLNISLDVRAGGAKGPSTGQTGLVQLILAQVRRQAASASPATAKPLSWSMPHPQVDIAASISEPLGGETNTLVQDMASVAKTRCLLCGEPVHDVQTWRRHIKQKHSTQQPIAQNLVESDALLQASVIRPCVWCKVHFQKSAREHRRKCLPLLQLCLYHDAFAHGDRAGVADGSSVGPQLSNGVDTTVPKNGKGPAQIAEHAAAQISQGSRKGRWQNGSASQERPRTGGGGVPDGSRYGFGRGNNPESHETADSLATNSLPSSRPIGALCSLWKRTVMESCRCSPKQAPPGIRNTRRGQSQRR